ncbi:MAG: hypothetical protein KDD29_00520 [Flavobacteriales bacterium]|nr:hypothetical protein [Flavobacteriales bacterium]MCB9336144.1 hypothetical protein [Flavobacteriales bacterium]
MRLGQLSRQLEVKPEQIIAFLEKKGIAIKHHPNAKVEDELIEEISTHFKPVAPSPEPEVKKEAPKKEPEVKKQTDSETSSEITITEPQHIETVKPEALSGPKIIGKIDLPDKSKINVEVDGVVYDMETLESKKKENLQEERERRIAEKEAKEKAEQEAKEQARLKREEEQARKAKIEAEKQEKRLREKEKQRAILLQKKEKEKAEQEKKRKEKQKEFYHQKFKPKTKSAPPKKQEVEEKITTENTVVTSQPEVKEKSLYKRFIKWLNT